jgi:hypothetical protein
MAKRVKYVYADNDAIAHLWVGHNLSSEGQDNARNPRGNFYFRGATIYSYGGHFPIAEFVRNGKKKAIQFTTRSYSVTTRKHISEVRGAIRGNSNLPVFNVYFMHQPPQDNVSDYLARINTAIANQAKSRATHNIAGYQRDALDLKAECQRYCAFWKIKTPKFPKIEALPADFLERRKREEETQKKRDAANRALRAAQVKEWDKLNAEKIEKQRAAILEWNANSEQHITDWLMGGSLNLPSSFSHWYSTEQNMPVLNEPPTLLRLKGSEVETSRHASFPIEHAVRGLMLVRAVMQRGQDWEANGHTCKLGLYQISKITADGTVTAGCHVVPWSSIERIAPALDNWAKIAEEESYTGKLQGGN